MQILNIHTAIFIHFFSLCPLGLAIKLNLIYRKWPIGYEVMLSLLLFLSGKRSFVLFDNTFFSFSVIFHVATLMPTRDSDPGCNSKKMHIGNDFVTIVYNDSQQTVKFGRIKVRFSFLRRLVLGLSRSLPTPLLLLPNVCGSA